MLPSFYCMLQMILRNDRLFIVFTELHYFSVIKFTEQLVLNVHLQDAQQIY